MRTRVARRVFVTLFCAGSIALTGSSVQAQGFVSPQFGTHFSTPSDSGSITVGGSAGVMAGLIGFEVDFGFAPDFFPPEHTSSTLHAVGDLSTLMANVVIGNFTRNELGGGYISGGVGAVRILADEPDGRFDPRGTDLGFNIGGGAVGFFNDSVGIRGDVRYFRDVRSDELSAGSFDHRDDIHFGSFGFFRATIGVILRF